MLKEPDRLRLKPWFDDGAGELTVLSAFCIVQFLLLVVEGRGFRLACRRSTSLVIAFQLRFGRDRKILV